MSMLVSDEIIKASGLSEDGVG